MTFTAKNKNTNYVKRFSSFDGSWDKYKEYLLENGVLSSNFQRQFGELVLRPGYHPEWTAKDFR